MERYSWYKNCLDWPAMQWTSFLDSEGHPLDIVSFTQSDGMCIEVTINILVLVSGHTGKAFIISRIPV